MAKQEAKRFNKKKQRKSFPSNRKTAADDRLSARESDFSQHHNPVGGDNDVRWYAANPQLIKDTASYPFQFPLGTKHNMGGDDKYISASSVPGVCAIHWDPSIGMANDEIDAVNIAMRNIYSFIRHANSGKTNYEAPDLMLYLLAMSDILGYHAALKRIYGVAMTYSHTNRYVPKAIVEALGVDYEDIQMHLCDLRSYINTFAVRVGSFCVPASMPYIARHVWMNSHIYVDSDQDKPQIYTYVQDHFFRFGLDDTPAGKLFFEGFAPRQIGQIGSFDDTATATKGLRFDELAAFGNTLLAPIIASEDFGIMSGDILKAYTPAEVYRVELIPENYVVMAEYSEEVLDQINNATLFGINAFNIGVGKDMAITQTTGLNQGYLVENHPIYWFSNLATKEAVDTKLVTQVLRPAYSHDRFLNFDHGDVQPESVLVATRMTGTGKPILALGYDGGAKRIWALNLPDGSTGSEIGLYMRIMYYQNGNDGQPQSATNSYVLKTSEMIFSCNAYELFSSAVSDEAGMNTVVNVFSYALARAQMLSKFRRHPLLYEGGFASISPTGEAAVGQATHVLDVLGDLNYYTVISSENLKQMSAMALLSEFDVTQFGRKA